MNDLQVCWWPIAKVIPYARNSRKIPERAIDKVAASIREFGWRVPIVVDKNSVIICGHTRLLAATRLGCHEVPVHVAENLTPAQVKAYRLMDNRSHDESDWDLDLLGPELEELRGLDFDLSLTGFDEREVDEFLADPDADERANLVPPVPPNPAAKPGDVWVMGGHRFVCGDCTEADVVGRLLGTVRPNLMVTDPPYGIELDSEWRDRAGLNSAPGKPRTKESKAAAKANPLYPAEQSYMKHRTAGHTETTISGDTIADWSHAFELLPSLQVAYVWHASRYAIEVLQGLLRIGFLYPQQIIWNKNVAALTRTHYWFKHEPCYYVRKKNAPWFGKPGENVSVWDAISPKMIMGGSKEEKIDHPTQKPVELMRRPILNHTKRGEAIYDPFLGSGTTLIAAELTGRACYGIELDPKYVDVICLRYINFSGRPVLLESAGQTFEQVKADRLGVAA